jgi:uncharacterized protein (DUF302 family)
MTDSFPNNQPGVVTTKHSPRSVHETVSRLTDLLREQGVKVFGVIDQAAEARQAGLQLRDTVLVTFGNPSGGTPVMAASPLAGLDLPLKILVWDDTNQTKVSYYGPAALAGWHHLSPDVAGKLAVIDSVTDALVAA